MGITGQEAIASLNEEFKRRLEAECAQGMVDMKVFPRITDETITPEIVWTVNNALKRSQDPDVSTYDSSQVNKAFEKHFRAA